MTLAKLECPRCGHSKDSGRFRSFISHADREVVAEARSRQLAEKWGGEDEYDKIGDYHDLGEQAETELFVSASEQRDSTTTEFDELCETLVDEQSSALTERELLFETLVDESMDAFYEQDVDDVDISVQEQIDVHFGGDRDPVTVESKVTSEIPNPDDIYDVRGGINLATPGQQELGARLTDVSPYRSEELPRIVDQILPATIRATRNLAAREGRPIDKLLTSPNSETVSMNHLAAEYGISGGNGDFGATICRAAAMDDDLPDQLRDELTSYGSGQEPEDRDVDGLRRAHIALLQAADVTPSLHLVLDGRKWIDLDDKRTAGRLLSVLDELAKAVDIRISASPRVQRHLDNQFPDWVDDHEIDLITSRDGSRPTPQAEDDLTQRAAYQTMQQFNGDGRRRVVAALDTQTSRSVSELKADQEIDLAESSVDRYVGDLEDADLVDVDRRDGLDSNRVSLTQFGKLAKRLITPEFDLLPPEQQTLGESPYGLPTDANKYSVSSAGEHGVGSPGRSAAEWVASTGPADSSERFTQWLDGHGSEISPYALHKRFEAVSKTEGITLADGSVREFEDGRVTYLSIFEDSLQAVTQWGGSAATLGRIAAALSGWKVWSKILSVEALGEDLSGLHDADLNPEDLLNQLQRGSQIGWAGKEKIVDDDGINYDDFSRRLYLVGRNLLSKLSDLAEMETSDRSAFFRDAHGLLTTMTTLLDLAGVDTTIHLQFPDTDGVISNPQVNRDVVQFLRHTVPKQSRYGIHSGWRQVIEDREDKLQFRLPMDVDRANPEAELTTSWVLAGDGIDRLHDELAAGIESVEPRESLQDGTEDGIGITVPIEVGGTTGHCKRIVREIAAQKGWSHHLEDIDRITRVCMSALAHARCRASPYLVADTMLAMGKRKFGSDLSASDVQAGLTRLAPADLYPTHAPTVGILVSTLLRSNEPLEAAELVDTSGVARKSYGRQIDQLSDMDLLRRTSDGWTVTLAPWWAPTSTLDEPDADLRRTPTGDVILPTEPLDAREILDELANSLQWRDQIDVDGLGDLAIEYGGRPPLDVILEAVPQLEDWMPIIETLWPSDGVGETGGTLRTPDTDAVGRSQTTGQKTGGTLRTPDMGSTEVSIGQVSDGSTTQNTLA